MYRISLLSDVILYKFYEVHVSSDTPAELSSLEVRAELGVDISLNLINSAIEYARAARRYHEPNFIKRSGIKGNYKYEISIDGIQYVESELRRRDSPIAYFSANGDQSLSYVAGISSDFMTRGERVSSADWQPLEIDRQNESYKETVLELENAIDVIEKDNAFAAHMPQERSGILESLKFGLDWLKSKAPTVSQIRAMLVGPLNWISTTFPNSIMSEAAKKAASKLVDFVSSLF